MQTILLNIKINFERKTFHPYHVVVSAFNWFKSFHCEIHVMNNKRQAMSMKMTELFPFKPICKEMESK